jgi:hypothetical protein
MYSLQFKGKRNAASFKMLKKKKNEEKISEWCS